MNCGKVEEKRKPLKSPKSHYFFHFWEKCFLKQTLGLRKSFLNQTTYVLKNWFYPQSFLNRDSFFNQAFLNRDSTVIFFSIRFYTPKVGTS